MTTHDIIAKLDTCTRSVLVLDNAAIVDTMISGRPLMTSKYRSMSMRSVVYESTRANSILRRGQRVRVPIADLIQDNVILRWVI